MRDFGSLLATGGHPCSRWNCFERSRIGVTSSGMQTEVWREGPRLDWGVLPGRVEAVIAMRLGRLEQRARDLLTVAAVEGETFTAQVAAQVLGLGEREALTTLSRDLGARQRLIREAGEIRAGGRFVTGIPLAMRSSKNICTGS